MTTIHGVIHGRTIELEQEPGLAEGQRVAVDLRVVDEPPVWLKRLNVDPAVEAVRHYARVPEGLRRSFGAWAEEAGELDEYLAWTRQQRKLRRREIEE